VTEQATPTPKARPAKVAGFTRLIILGLALLSGLFVVSLLGALSKTPKADYSRPKEPGG
jgi:hypothetical protein